MLKELWMKIRYKRKASVDSRVMEDLRDFLAQNYVPEQVGPLDAADLSETGASYSSQTPGTSYTLPDSETAYRIAIPEEAMPDNSVPGAVMPAELLPEEAAQKEAIPDEAIPTEILLDGVVSEESMPVEAASDEDFSDEAMQDVAVSDDFEADLTAAFDSFEEETTSDLGDAEVPVAHGIGSAAVDKAGVEQEHQHDQHDDGDGADRPAALALCSLLRLFLKGEGLLVRAGLACGLTQLLFG